MQGSCSIIVCTSHFFYISSIFFNRNLCNCYFVTVSEFQSLDEPCTIVCNGFMHYIIFVSLTYLLPLWLLIIIWKYKTYKLWLIRLVVWILTPLLWQTYKNISDKTFINLNSELRKYRYNAGKALKNNTGMNKF